MSITLHTDPVTGSSHATVQSEIGETIARFFGMYCAENAKLFADLLGSGGFDDYQRRAGETAVYPYGYGQTYTVLGLASEAGEVAALMKRAIRDSTPEAELAARVRDELGDCLWYIANCAREFGFNLSDIAQANLDKLASRQSRGVIHGEGGER